MILNGMRVCIKFENLAVLIDWEAFASPLSPAHLPGKIYHAACWICLAATQLVMNPGPSCNKNCLKIFDSSHIPEFVFSPRPFSWPSVAVLSTSAMIFIENNVPLDSKYKKSTTLIFLRKPGELWGFWILASFVGGHLLYWRSLVAYVPR